MRNEMKAIQAFVADLEFTGFESVEEAVMVPFEEMGGDSQPDPVNVVCKYNHEVCRESQNKVGCQNMKMCDQSNNEQTCQNFYYCSLTNDCTVITGGGSGGNGGGSNSALIGFPGVLF